MSMRRIVTATLLTFALGAVANAADTPKLGKPISEADLKAWNITVGQNWNSTGKVQRRPRMRANK